MTDIDIFPVIAFLIFMIFFLGLFVYVLRLDKREVNEMAAMPLDDQSLTEAIPTPSTTGQS